MKWQLRGLKRHRDDDEHRSKVQRGRELGMHANPRGDLVEIEAADVAMDQSKTGQEATVREPADQELLVRCNQRSGPVAIKRQQLV